MSSTSARLRGDSIAEKLELNSKPEGDCLRWTGAHTPKGYGHLTVNGRRRAVHRVAYETWVGAIPEGLEVDHLCSVRDCINPKHLEVVTHAENVRRTFARGRWARSARPLQCPAGHEISGDNVKPSRRGPRCRECHNTQRRRWWQARYGASRDEPCSIAEGFGITSVEWRYLPGSKVKHAIQSSLYVGVSGAVCGVSALPASLWRGTGSQAEYDAIERLRPCARCQSRLTTEGASDAVH